MLKTLRGLGCGINGRPHISGECSARIGLKNRPRGDFFAWIRANFDPAITWKDWNGFATRWQGPIILRECLDPEDAREAVRVGSEWRSGLQHGGRQLDGVLSRRGHCPLSPTAVKGQL